MAWVTPVYDRVLSDVTTPTSKGYMNVADWTRIYGNALILNGQANTFTGTTITFDTISTPTTSTVPTFADLNKLFHNVERVRLAIALPDSYGLRPLRYTWGSVGFYSPAWYDINQLEKTIDVLYAYVNTPPTPTDSWHLMTVGIGNFSYPSGEWQSAGDGGLTDNGVAGYVYSLTSLAGDALNAFSAESAPTIAQLQIKYVQQPATSGLRQYRGGVFEIRTTVGGVLLATVDTLGTLDYNAIYTSPAYFPFTERISFFDVTPGGRVGSASIVSVRWKAF